MAHGVFSFTQVDDAAEAAVAAIDAPAGIYNAVDDEPLAARDWLPAFARALDGPPPATVDPAEALERLGWTTVHRLTEQRGALNARARERFGWKPRHPRFEPGGESRNPLSAPWGCRTLRRNMKRNVPDP